MSKLYMTEQEIKTLMMLARKVPRKLTGESGTFQASARSTTDAMQTGGFHETHQTAGL